MSTAVSDLIDAIKRGDVDLVCEYVNNEEGVLDINKRESRCSCYFLLTPLHYAVLFNTGTAIMELLLAKGAKTEIGNEYGITPLIDAARTPKSLEKLQCLLKHGAQANYCTKWKDTALHAASFNANVAAVRILLEHGADVHARDRTGKTSLQGAAQAYEHEDATTCLQVLLDHGADILTRDDHGRTLLHNAIHGVRQIQNRHDRFLMEIMSFLLDKKKIDLNATDHHDGNTVLHYCVIYTGNHAPDVCRELTRMLLAHDAQIQIQNQRLETVFHLAIKDKKLQETVQLLLTNSTLRDIDRHSVLSMTDDNRCTAFQYARYKGGAQSLLEQLTDNGEDVLPCCHDLFFAKNGQGRTLSQELQADLDSQTPLNDTLETSLLLEYLHSFTENALSVPESTEHGTTSAIPVRINPLLNDFQRVLANRMLRMSLVCPDVSTHVMDELPESIKLVTMGYLAPVDVMKRNP